MTTELFSGSPQDLKDRLDALVAGGATDFTVVKTDEKTTYFISYT